MSDQTETEMPTAEGWMGHIDRMAAPKVGFDPAT